MRRDQGNYNQLAGATRATLPRTKTARWSYAGQRPGHCQLATAMQTADYKIYQLASLDMPSIEGVDTF
jgi:hypothetical protein